MKQRFKLLFAVFASFLVVSVAPVGAGHAGFAVGSENTTDGDFNNATALDNVTVEGSGTGAYVNFESSSPTFYSDFEDEPADSGVPENMQTYGSAINTVNVSTNYADSGSQSVYVDTGSVESGIHPVSQPYGTAKTENVSVDIYALDSGEYHASVKLFEGEDVSGNRLLIVGMRGGDLAYYNGASWNTISTVPNNNEWVHVEIHDINPSSDTYAVSWSTSTNSGSATGLSMENPATSGYNIAAIAPFQAAGYFDDYSIGGQVIETGAYESSTHQVDNAKQAMVNLSSVSNSSIEVQALYYDTSSSSWKVDNSTTVTSDQSVALNLSANAQDWRTKVIFNQTGDQATARITEEKVLFAAREPSADNGSATPAGGTATNNEDVTLSVPVSDPDFATAQGDSVTVDILVDGSVIDTQTITSNQTVSTTATNLLDGNHSWRVELSDSYGETSTSSTYNFTVNHYSPAFDNTNASPQNSKLLTSKNVTLSIPLNDSDFAEPSGDSVTVDVYYDGSVIDTQTITSNGTVSTSVSVSLGGNHTWHVQATDEYGQSTTSDTFSFVAPSEITFYNESNPDAIVTDAQIDITAYYGGETLTRNTSNGVIDLSGFPTDQPITIRATADGYTTRTLVLESIYEQSSVFMLNDSVPTYQVRFDLQDPTGDYPMADTVLFVERDLEQNGSVEWRTIAGDNFGVQGVPVDLEQNERYRLRIKNLDTGDTVTIGSFTAIQSETVTLSPGSATIDIEGSDKDYGWELSHNRTSQNILFEYEDTANLTSSVKLTIHERFNKSNVLVDNVSFSDANSIVYQEPLTANESNQTWMAEIYVDRGNGYIEFREAVGGPSGNIIPVDLDGTWQSAIGVFILLITGMAFSELNGVGGALATALVGGMLWQIGLLSTITTGPAVVLAIAIPAIYQFKSGGGI